MNKILNICAISVASGSALSIAAVAQKPIEIKFDGVDQKGAAKLGYYPVQIKLSDVKPASIVKEPNYNAKPRYGTIKLGNGRKSEYIIAVDEPTDADSKIYIDANQNGDLTDDGDGAWSKKNNNNGRIMYGINTYTLNASYTKGDSVPYTLNFYRFVGQDFVLMYRSAARTGNVKIGGKKHKAKLIENDADALYSKSLDDNGKPVSGITATKPVWLAIDKNDDDKFLQVIDIRSPFKLDEVAYEAKVNAMGTRVKLVGTKRVVADKPKAPELKPLLAKGTTAPDFTSEAYGGGECRLSDFRGKVVILDFWATWCGPCMQSMPHIEKLYQSVKGQDVVVLGLCVFDEKQAYEKWVPANNSKYSFKFAYDPAGRGNNSIAGDKYHVSGIPTTYIIDKDGKVADSIVGYSDGDKQVEEALKKLGINASNQK